MSRAKGMRRVRGMQAGIVVFEVGDAAFEAFRGHVGFALIPVACAVLIVVAMLWLTRKIRQREHLDRPRPDYASIAAMERDIWGETFEHEGAPAVRRTVSGPHGHPSAGLHQVCSLCGIPGTFARGACRDCYRAHRSAGVPARAIKILPGEDGQRCWPDPW